MIISHPSAIDLSLHTVRINLRLGELIPEASIETKGLLNVPIYCCTVPAMTHSLSWYIIKPLNVRLFLFFDSEKSSFYLEAIQGRSVCFRRSGSSTYNFWVTSNNEIIYKSTYPVTIRSCKRDCNFTVSLYKDGNTQPTDSDGVLMLEA